MKIKMLSLAVYFFGFVSISLAQEDTTWSRWSWLIGDWVGEGSGTPGQGTGWFSLHSSLGGKILLRKNHSEYPAAKEKREIVHDDIMIIYLDDSNQPSKAIYFDNEGHTINYMISYPGTGIVFTSTKVQDAPIYRLTYAPLDTDAINVKFEMSKDGEKFLTYLEGKCRKKK